MSKKDENPKRKSLNIGHPTYYINRELSMLAFQRRVLDEAKDKQNPLLERVKFLAIVGNNLDEFFMVRVGGLKMQYDAGIVRLSIDGKSPAEQLAVIRSEAYDLMVDARDLWKNELLPELNQAGIHLLGYEQLSDKQRESVDEFFHEVIHADRSFRMAIPPSVLFGLDDSSIRQSDFDLGRTYTRAILHVTNLVKPISHFV